MAEGHSRICVGTLHHKRVCHHGTREEERHSCNSIDGGGLWPQTTLRLSWTAEQCPVGSAHGLCAPRSEIRPNFHRFGEVVLPRRRLKGHHPPCRWATVSADRRRAALRTARCLPHGGGCNVDDGGISLVDEASGCEDVDTFAAALDAQSSAWRVSWCDAGGGWGTAGGRAPPGGRAARSRLTPLTSDWQRLKWRNTEPSMGFSSRPHRRAGPEGVPVLPGSHAHLWGPTGSAA